MIYKIRVGNSMLFILFLHTHCIIRGSLLRRKGLEYFLPYIELICPMVYTNNNGPLNINVFVPFYRKMWKTHEFYARSNVYATTLPSNLKKELMITA